MFVLFQTVFQSKDFSGIELLCRSKLRISGDISLHKSFIFRIEFIKKIPLIRSTLNRNRSCNQVKRPAWIRKKQTPSLEQLLKLAWNKCVIFEKLRLKSTCTKSTGQSQEG